MSRRGENIYKRKDGRWEGRYIKGVNQDGKSLQGYIYAKTYAEAKRKLAEQKSKVYKHEQSDLILYNDIKYQQLIYIWLESIQMHVKESTYAHYCQLIVSHIIPAFGSYRLKQINNILIERKITSMMIEGRIDNAGGLSPKTVSDILSIIKSSISFAQYNNYMSFCDLSRLIIKKHQKEMRVLSEKEQYELEMILSKDVDLSKMGVLLCLYTGIRIGELCALTWDNIDLENGIIHVCKTMQRIKDISNNNSNKTKIIITEPKSNCSIRDIPLVSFLVNYLKKYRAEQDAYLLTGTSERYIEPRVMQYHFKKYTNECSLKDVNFHALRHTFATRCIENGFEIKSLSEILGHANVNITLNRYVHSSFELKRQNINKLENLRKL